MNVKILPILGSALPPLAIAVVFLWPTATGTYLPGTDVRSLGYVMQLEFVAMASGMFLLMPLLIESHNTPGYVIRLVLFAGFSLTFASIVADEWGWRGVLAYGALIFLSYGGNSLFTKGSRLRNFRAYLAAFRWLIYILVFFSLVVVFDLGEGNISRWDGKTEAVHMGATFFSIMFLLEVSLFAFAGQFVDKLLTEKEIKEVALNERMMARKRFYDAISRATKEKP